MIVLIAFIFLTITAGLIFYLIKKPEQGQICFGNDCFAVEIASRAKDRQKGLMFREDLEKDKGMLFVFKKEGEYSFWMKNVLMPLDIIWLDKDKKVVHIAENCQPCPQPPCPSIKPGKKAKYVLEINGGLALKKGIKEGDRAELQYD